MEQWAGLGEGLSQLLVLNVIAAVIAGTLIGMIVGAIPGLGTAVGFSMMIPLIFYWPPAIGLVLLTALWMGDNYGGSISSVLLGIPGTTGAVFTMIDGYPMCQQGKGKVALGNALSASAVGGLIGALFFLMLAPPLAALAFRFGPAEYFLTVFLGLTVITSISRGNLSKSLMAACIGIIVGIVGIDYMTGYPRFTFGTVYLLDRPAVQVVVLGIFAVGRLLAAGAEYESVLGVKKPLGTMLDGMRQAFRYPITLIRSAIIGSIIGALPGAGLSVATPLAYQQTVSASRHPETFGKGDPEGVIAPEAANNALQGGSLVPTLTLGIPGSLTGAIFLAIIVMYGFTPGPRTFVTHAVLIWEIWWAIVAAVFFMVLLGLLFNPLFVKVIQCPLRYLIPITFTLIIAGAFTANYNPLDFVALLIFGVLGFLMGRRGYPLVPFILAYILGPLAEDNFCRALLISQGSFSIFFGGVINPILIFLCILSLARYFWTEWRAKKREESVSQ